MFGLGYVLRVVNVKIFFEIYNYIVGLVLLLLFYLINKEFEFRKFK